MTPEEIIAFARRANLDQAMHGKKVRIQREDGKYLAPANTWTEDRECAQRFDYNADRVGEQLEAVERQYGAKWTAEIISP